MGLESPGTAWQSHAMEGGTEPPSITQGPQTGSPLLQGTAVPAATLPTLCLLLGDISVPSCHCRTHPWSSPGWGAPLHVPPP